jgi:prophage regulatory protein
MADRILRENEVAQATGLGRSTRYCMEREGRFPRRRRIGQSAVGWLESEIQQWIESRAVGTVATAPSTRARTGASE